MKKYAWKQGVVLHVCVLPLTINEVFSDEAMLLYHSFHVYLFLIIHTIRCMINWFRSFSENSISFQPNT